MAGAFGSPDIKVEGSDGLPDDVEDDAVADEEQLDEDDDDDDDAELENGPTEDD